MDSDITESELLNALHLEAAGGVDTGEGYTTRELMALTGWGEKKLLRTVEKMIIAGSMERLYVSRKSPLTEVTRGGINAYRPVASRD